ncbi:endonuclease/exonuclease/phosphatase family protein [Solicola sp. PLA-1-18]|uniref:endonuclease/exonuclease/phosphatase family protein n=1 Tax=Solicola sp. PLA-1-18 TaxID=3380532 RepID=UPI003B82623B
MTSQTVPPSMLRVATWNVYLGADLEPLVRSGDGETLAKATREALQQAERTRFPERAELIADAIGSARPDVVGLQELGRWEIHSPDGREVLWDHAQLVSEALERRGHPYVMLHCSDTFSGRLPLDDERSVGFTNCDAMLLRASPDRPITVLDAEHGHFDARLRLTLPDDSETFDVKRGWVQADLEVEGHHVRVVTTHLDSMDDGVRLRQAHELVATTSTSPYPVVLVGDLNTADGDGVLDVLLRAGYQDAWQLAGVGDGLTWGRTPDLDVDADLRERIDYVLLDPEHLAARSVDLIGDGAQPDPRGTTLWASDHAGVLAELEIS